MQGNLRLGIVGTKHAAGPDGLHKVIVRGEAGGDWLLPQGSEESIWAERLASGGFRIDNIPFFAKGINYDDVVDTVESDGALIVTGICARGGHSTYRAVVDERAVRMKHADYHALLDGLREIGAGIEAATSLYFAIDVPPNVPVDAVIDVLQLGVDEGIWDFEEGHRAY